MNPYHKIATVFNRDTNNHSLIHGSFSRASFEALADLIWRWEEKVYGTNTRVIYDPDAPFSTQMVRFAGKEEGSVLPTELEWKLEKLFPVEKLEAVFGGSPATLYGEGYGGGIQGGGGYGEVDFILFDVFFAGIFFARAGVEGLASDLEVDDVPVLARGSLMAAVHAVESDSLKSGLRDGPPEGLILRPPVDLWDATGERVIAKIKRKDFA